MNLWKFHKVSRRVPSLRLVGLCCTLTLSGLTGVRGVTVQFDTSLDTAGFFGSGTQARGVLDAAAVYLSALLEDDLDAVAPSGGNQWQIFYVNPESGFPTFVSNPNVPADTLVVYVGSQDLGGGLGSASPGIGQFISGSAAWRDTVETRGEATGTDFGPWGGTLTVSNTIDWDYSTTGASAGKYSLYSNILHEVAHVLGLGTSTSWAGQTNEASNVFLGSAAVAEYGSSVPLESDDAHVLDGTTSTLPGTSAPTGVSFDPSLAQGEFKPFSSLDLAILEDMGWEIATIPEPEVTPLLIALAFAGGLRRRRGSV